MENEIVYSAQEVADILKIKKNTIYSMIQRGDLVAYKVGNKVRISNIELEKFKMRSLSIQPIEDNTKMNVATQHDYSATRIIDEPVQRETGFIICGQDAALDTLARYLQSQRSSTKVLRSYVGSYNGLYMLYQGQVNVATAHLWNGKDDEYNTAYVERMLPGIPTVLIRLFKRMQGFYVKKGNPKNILSWDDLKRNDITIVNREKGSGTRILLDEKLRLNGINPDSIAGYYKECFSHLTIAGAVARGSADVGIGTFSSSKLIAGLDFIPLQKECYDIIIKKEDLNKFIFQDIIQIIRSNEFRMELEGMEEYDISELGKIVAET